MAFANKHLHIRLNGGFGAVLANPLDRWSVGLRLGVPGTDSQLATPALLTLLNSIHTAAVTMHNSANMSVGGNCSFINVQGARVGVDGKYDPVGQITRFSTGAGIFGATTPINPWNTALSFGLRTAQPRGYASNGRVYYPAIGTSVSSADGRVSATLVANRLTAFRTFLNAVNTAANVYETGTRVCVMSKVGAGVTEPVTAIRSDNRLDSIERRENDQAPVYTLQALP